MSMKGCLRRREIVQLTGLSASTIQRLERAGEFPRHFQLTPRCSAWDRSEVEAWMILRRQGVVAPQQVPVRAAA